MIGVAALCAAPAPAGAIELDDATYQNQRIGLKLNVPDGWILHRQTGFPSLLLLLARKQGSATISLALADLPPKLAMSQFLSDNDAGLRALGLQISGTRQLTIGGQPAWGVNARVRDGSTEVRQIHLPRADRVFILTLTCPRTAVRELAFELKQLLEVLEIRRPDYQQSIELQPTNGANDEAPPIDTDLPPRGLEQGDPAMDEGPALEETGPAAAPDIGTKGAPRKDLERKPSFDSRPSGDTGPTVDSRPNKPRSRPPPATRPTSQPAAGGKEQR